jgi:O-methyltransferase involved in polyketide biosynthesis
VIPYLTKPEQNKLFNFLETKLKKGSLVAVGKYDERVDAEEMLRRGGFEETDIWFLYKKV